MDVQSTRTEPAQAGQTIPQHTRQAGQNAGMIDLFAAALANSEQRLDTLDPDARRERRQARDPHDHDPTDGYFDGPRAPEPSPKYDQARAAAEPRAENARNHEMPAKPQKTDPAGPPERPTTPAIQRADRSTPQAAANPGATALDGGRAATQMAPPRVAAPTSALTAQSATGPAAPTLVSTDDLTAATARLTAPNTLTPRGAGEAAGQNAGQNTGQNTGLNIGQTGQTASLAPGHAAGQAKPATGAPVLADGQGSNPDANTEARSPAGAARATEPAALSSPTTGREAITDLPAAAARVRGDAPSLRANSPGAVSQTTASAAAVPTPGNNPSARVAPVVKLTPAQGREVVKQVTVQLTKGATAGDSTIKIQLRPVELGKVDVKLEISNSTLVKAVVLVEKPETLELLQRDARVLERALQDAGLKTGGNSLSFALNDQGGSGRNRDDDGTPRGGGEMIADATQNDGTPTQAAADQPSQVGDGLVNMVAEATNYDD